MALDIIGLIVVLALVGYGWHRAKQQSQRWAHNKREGERYWQQQRQREGVVEVGDGVLMEYQQHGSGTESPQATQRIHVHYTGRLVDGTVFDCSRQRGEALQLCPNQVIVGWQQALQTMVVGDRVELTIPAQLAYGRRKAGAILPYSTLIFDLELLAVEAS